MYNHVYTTKYLTVFYTTIDLLFSAVIQIIQFTNNIQETTIRPNIMSSTTYLFFCSICSIEHIVHIAWLDRRGYSFKTDAYSHVPNIHVYCYTAIAINCFILYQITVRRT